MLGAGIVRAQNGAHKHVGKLFRYKFAAEIAIWPIPAGEPIDRAHEEEDRKLWIAAFDVIFGQSRLDKVAHMALEVVAMPCDEGPVFAR